MIHDMVPGTEEHLNLRMVTAYVGIDPTADSLHIGHLVSIVMLRWLQAYGHRPIVLVGGATGMIGDPSGKSQERNLLDEQALKRNQEGIKKQLEKLLDFSDKPNGAILVNNYDWMNKFSFLEFIRDIGKHLTVNYMMSKESVKQRISGSESKAGMSFTEFSYQLVQGTDFLHLYREYDCTLQMGGSDQWGNITTGTELIRRKEQGEAFALTCPLVTKADGKKFGKTEQGNVWLDPKRTSPYQFYQFWMNTTDNEAEGFIKVFTELAHNEISNLITKHQSEPHLRHLQKRLAKELTVMIHSEEAYKMAEQASSVLFGKATERELQALDEETFLEVFQGVEQRELALSKLEENTLLQLLTEQTNILPSKSEARRIILGNGLSINKRKAVDPDMRLTAQDLLSKKYLLVQRGKKSYSIIYLK